jgi:NADH dehydrogenase [ubiquinone] 1 alpha subcomplex assembly factor 1
MTFIAYLSRSLQHLKQQAKNALEFSPPHPTEKTLFRFQSIQDCERFLVGSDADIGGYSEAYWGWTPQKTGLFWGTISTQIPPKLGIDRSGYAGIKSKLMPMVLLHRPMIDTSLFRYLEIRARGDDKQFMINIQTESLYSSIIWQHKLFFSEPGQWEIIRIPFRDFVRTSHGYL